MRECFDCRKINKQSKKFILNHRYLSPNPHNLGSQTVHHARPENLNRPLWSVLIFSKRGERIGQSNEVAHDQYADEQLTTIQKRICLIEFLFMVGLLFVKEESPRPPFAPMVLRVASHEIQNRH